MELFILGLVLLSCTASQAGASPLTLESPGGGDYVNYLDSAEILSTTSPTQVATESAQVIITTAVPQANTEEVTSSTPTAQVPTAATEVTTTASSPVTSPPISVEASEVTSEQPPQVLTVSSSETTATSELEPIEIATPPESIQRHLESKFLLDYPPCNASSPLDLFNSSRLDDLLTKIHILHHYINLPLAPTYEALLNVILRSPHVCAQDYVRLAFQIRSDSNSSSNQAWRHLQNRFHPKIFNLFDTERQWKIFPVEHPHLSLLTSNLSSPSWEGLATTLLQPAEAEDDSAKWRLIPLESGSYFQLQNVQFGTYFKGFYSHMIPDSFSKLMLVPSQQSLRRSIAEDEVEDLDLYFVRPVGRAAVGVASIDEAWQQLEEKDVGEDTWALKRIDDTYLGAALFRFV